MWGWRWVGWQITIPLNKMPIRKQFHSIPKKDPAHYTTLRPAYCNKDFSYFWPNIYLALFIFPFIFFFFWFLLFFSPSLILALEESFPSFQHYVVVVFPLVFFLFFIFLQPSKAFSQIDDCISGFKVPIEL